MPDKEKPLLSIGDDGIKINLKKGDSIKTNANEIFMRGVEQNVVGGTLGTPCYRKPDANWQ